MWLFSLLTIPIIGAIIISSTSSNRTSSKTIALVTSTINMVLSLIIFAIFNYSTNQFQYVEGHFGVYLGIDGISIYFITLTTIILPIVLLSNWDSLKVNIKYYLIIMLLLEGLLLGVFMALDLMLFYILFESILPPLFILIVRHCAFVRSLCELQIHYPYMYKSPVLGSLRKYMPNIAWLEKPWSVIKQLITMVGEDKIDTVRAIQPKDQLPVLLNKGDVLFSWKKSFLQCIGQPHWMAYRGKLKMRWVKNSIKVTNDQPKSIYSLSDVWTMVSTKGINSYVAGGPELVVSTLKGVTRRNGPVFIWSRGLSTGTGRTTNVLKRLDDLHGRGQMTDGIIDRNLYRDYLLDYDMYLVAYKKLRSKPMASRQEVIEEIITKLRSGEFQFGRVNSNGLGNPRDILVQEIMRMVLEAIYEPLFKDSSFRPSRLTVFRTILTKFKGYGWWIQGDYKACFIAREELMRILGKRIKDQRFLELVRKALRSEKPDIIGTSQGSIISPVLANVFLHELDVYIGKLKEDSSPAPPDNTIDPKLREVIKYADRQDSKKIMYIRYANDWIIAVNGSHQETMEILKQVKDFSTSLGLIMSEEKTKITNIYKEKVLFLGTYIRHSQRGRGRGQGRGFLLTAPLDRIRDKLKKSGFLGKDRTAQVRITWVPLTTRQIIHQANSICRCFFNYYSFVHNRGKLEALVYWIIKDVTMRTLARKLNISTKAQVFKKFGRDLTILDYNKRDANNSPRIVASFIRPIRS